MSIFTELRAQIELLVASPRMEVPFHKDTLVPASEITTLRGTLSTVFGIQCSDSIAQSVEIDDQLNIYWRQQAGSSAADLPVGEFFLRSVLVFSGKNDLNAAFQREYDGVDLRHTRVFDYYPYNGGPVYALLPAAGEEIEDRVLIFNERQVSPTSLDYMAYLKELRLTRGFLYWQYLFCDRLDVEEYELRALQKGLAFVEREFSADDYSGLRERLKGLERRL